MRKPRLPVSRAALQNKPGKGNEVERSLRFLEAKGCDRKVLLRFVEQLSKARKQKPKLPQLDRKRDLQALDKAREAASRLLDDPLLREILYYNASLTAIPKEDIQDIRSLPRTLQVFGMFVKDWFGPGFPEFRIKDFPIKNGKRVTLVFPCALPPWLPQRKGVTEGRRPSRLKKLAPPNLLFYLLLDDLHKYVKKTTRHYYRQELAALLGSFDANQVNVEFRRAKELFGRYPAAALLKYISNLVLSETALTKL